MSKQDYELKKRDKEKELEEAKRVRQIKKWAKLGLVILVLAGGLAGLWRWGSSRPATTESVIISSGSIHWHPHLSITILGEEQEIPANVGIGFTPHPRNIHTHDATGELHLEFPGRVTEDDVRLGEFFKVWGKTFNADCILDKCNGEEGQVKMLVNGEPNFEFENYVMRDKDRIEIIYE